MQVQFRLDATAPLSSSQRRNSPALYIKGGLCFILWAIKKYQPSLSSSSSSFNRSTYRIYTQTTPTPPPEVAELYPIFCILPPTVPERALKKGLPAKTEISIFFCPYYWSTGPSTEVGTCLEFLEDSASSLLLQDEEMITRAMAAARQRKKYTSCSNKTKPG